MLQSPARLSFRRRLGALLALLAMSHAPSARADGAAATDADGYDVAPSAQAAGSSTAADNNVKPQAKGTRGFSLAQALELADRNHPNILAAKARLLYVRAQLDEAHSAPFSMFKISGGVGVYPEIAGTAAFSPDNDVSLSSGVALAWRVDLEGVLPLWTFGKIGYLWDAAEANVKVHEADIEKERDLVRLEVRRAYYGLLLARDGKLLLRDVRKQLDSADNALKAKVDAGEGDPVDLYKLETFAAELDIKEAEADKYVDVTLAGLRFYTGASDFDVPDVPLAPPSHELLPVERYLEAAEKYRPELAQVRYGIDARTAQVKLAEAGFYPNIGIGFTVGIGVAPEIDDQINPFANDPANYFRYGAALVFQWNLDFVPQLARLNQAKAQLAEMRATQQLADSGVEAEVRTAYAEVVDWRRRREAYLKATSKAKKWLIVVQQGIDVGTTEDKELLEPAKAYALGRFNGMNATMEYDLALAKLARATGWDSIAPDGTTPPAPTTP
ncbi:MAG: TolC family protein [Polyangiaceae bacterium]